VALHLGSEERPGPATSTALAVAGRAVAAWLSLDAPYADLCLEERALFMGFSGGDAPPDRGTIAEMGKRAHRKPPTDMLPVSTNAWLRNPRKTGRSWRKILFEPSLDGEYWPAAS
jgi:hypothetical protein